MLSIRPPEPPALSVRVEGEGHWSCLPRLVFGPGKVSVEDPADRVACQVFQSWIDDELVRSWCPGPAGHQLP
jgi:hypothetical protein